jgi:hypothetical protein
VDATAQKMIAERQALAGKPVSLPVFEKLLALEQQRGVFEAKAAKKQDCASRLSPIRPSEASRSL